MNTVKLSGLKPDTEYVYYVGDGQHWSEEKSFKTLFTGQDTNILIVGDTQATSSEGVEQLNEVLTSASKGRTFNLFIQTGDAIEKANSYSDWSNALTAFDNENLKGVDSLRIIGNHETYGDDNALIARTIEGIKNYNHYSVNYGNIHIAVLGYTESEEQWKENADWIIADAKKNASKAKWNILIMHQPPYGTNLNDKVEARVNKYIPSACDEAGIDFVFSGHDHSYARTEPMKNGEVDEKGTTYFIMGSTGEKSYSVNENKDYHFVKATNDFSGLYTTIETSNTKFKVTAYEKDGTEFDSYTKTKESACKESKHSYIAVDNKHLLCRKCKTSISISGYTGLVRDYDSGIARYLLKGKYVTDGWRAVGEDYYYFGKDGFAVTKTKVIDGKEYTFDKTGKFLKGSFVQETVSDGKKTRTITRYYKAGGSFAIHWLDIDGKTYYFRKTSNATTAFDGEMYTGDGVTPRFVRTVGDNQNRYYTFNPDGSLAVGAFDPEEVNGKTQYRYYWGDSYVTDKTMTIDGVEYTFDANGYTPEKSLSDCSISIKNVNVPYTGKEVKPAVDVVYKDANLKSNAHYTTKYSNNVKIGSASVTVSGSPYRGFAGSKKLSFAVVNPLTKNTDPISLSSKSRRVTVGWNKVTQGSGYIIYYSTKNSASSFKRLTTIKNNKTVRYKTKKLTKNKTYYFYVRTYRTIDGKTYYGPKSTVKKVKVK